MQVSLAAAYQLYVDGEFVGGAGDMRDGNFRLDIVHTHPLMRTATAGQTSLIALRILYRYSRPHQVVGNLRFGMVAGEAGALRWRHSDLIQGSLSYALPNLVWFGAVGVIGLVILGLFFNDRSRPELLILSIACVSVAGLFVTLFLVDTLANIPVAVGICGFWVFAVATSLTQIWFPFAAARRSMPILFWILYLLRAWSFPLRMCSPFLSPSHVLWLLGILDSWQLTRIGTVGEILSYSAAFVAFWPYWRIPRRMIAIAATCMVWGATMMVYFTGQPLFGRRFFDVMDPLQAFVEICASVMLLALLFRDQQRAGRERAELVGEMQAAQEIQRMLVQPSVDSMPGTRIEVAFHPMREVGGDFYSCRKLSDNRQRILLGDVSGKGAAAAMTTAVLLGAAQERDDDSPAALLEHLNQVLSKMRLGGFATCLCAELSAAGRLTIANAGHLSPYLDGAEVPVNAGLPLGIDATVEYEESQFLLHAGSRLTFLSDGVVEARNAHGELFGFDRTAAISSQSAEAIAQAAQVFGQEDDITVLTLTFASAEVLHA